MLRTSLYIFLTTVPYYGEDDRRGSVDAMNILRPCRICPNAHSLNSETLLFLTFIHGPRPCVAGGSEAFMFLRNPSQDLIRSGFGISCSDLQPAFSARKCLATSSTHVPGFRSEKGSDRGNVIRTSPAIILGTQPESRERKLIMSFGKVSARCLSRLGESVRHQFMR